MSTLIHERVASARSGTNPYVICRMKSGWAVLGDYQFFEGYSLLLPDPVVTDINELRTTQRAQYLVDMTLIGDALLACTDAYRINYEVLENSHQALHAHIFPRYLDEPEAYRKGPIWLYSKELRASVKFDQHANTELMNSLREHIMKLT